MHSMWNILSLSSSAVTVAAIDHVFFSVPICFVCTQRIGSDGKRNELVAVWLGWFGCRWLCCCCHRHSRTEGVRLRYTNRLMNVHEEAWNDTLVYTHTKHEKTLFSLAPSPSLLILHFHFNFLLSLHCVFVAHSHSCYLIWIGFFFQFQFRISPRWTQSYQTEAFFLFTRGHTLHFAK